VTGHDALRRRDDAATRTPVAIIGAVLQWLRLRWLYRQVDRPDNLTWETWLNLAGLVEAFRPTFVLELGRGYGNSTAVFTELSRRIGFDIVSIGFDSEHCWESFTAPKIRRLFGDDWFARLRLVQADLTRLDLARFVEREERVLLFWDAHGDDVAESALGLLTALPPENLVVVHDIHEAKIPDPPDDLITFSGPYISPFEELAHIWRFMLDSQIEATAQRYGLLSFRAPSGRKSDPAFVVREEAAEVRSRRPRFSIVLCTKNGMPFVREAIASLEAQTFTDYQLVIQDAVSTDGTAEYLRELDLPAVDMVSEPDSGKGDAYDRAFRRCRGEIVGSIDADNLLLPTALETADRLFREHPTAAAIYGASAMIDESGLPVRLFVPGPFDQRSVIRCELVPPFSTAFFHRDRCAPELRSDAVFFTCQDYDLWIRLSDRTIVRSRIVLGATRLSEISQSRDAGIYEQFSSDKMLALERFAARRPEFEGELDTAKAGIACWAAESVLELEGPGARFDSFLERAAAFDPEYERLDELRFRAGRVASATRRLDLEPHEV
jgi:hypothetical protein